MARLERLEELQRVRVVGAGTRLPVEPRYGFEVVVHHVGEPAFERFERGLEPAAEIGHQNFDPRLRRTFPDGADAVGEMSGTAVAEVVAVDAGDHHVGEPQCSNGLRKVPRLLGIGRLGPAVGDVAERAAPRAEVAEDHERRRALAEALADVRAGRLFADGVELRLAQDLLDLVEPRARAGRLDADPVGLRQAFCRHDLDRDAGGFCRAALLVTQFTHRSAMGRADYASASSSRCRPAASALPTASGVSRTPRSASRVTARPS